MNVKLARASGGEAVIIERQGDHVTLRSSSAAPPGSTLALSLALPNETEHLTVQVKVRGCKRDAEDPFPFRVEGRFVSLTRAARELLFGQP